MQNRPKVLHKGELQQQQKGKSCFPGPSLVPRDWALPPVTVSSKAFRTGRCSWALCSKWGAKQVVWSM